MSKKHEPSFSELRNAYSIQKHAAGKRGIPWKFDFIGWVAVWDLSGHLAERGRKRGQYVMARIGDIGPYSPVNVKIIQCNENVSFAQSHRIVKPSTRKLLSKPGELNSVAKLTNEQVKTIRRLYIPKSKVRGAQALANIYNVNFSVVMNVVKYRTYVEED